MKMMKVDEGVVEEGLADIPRTTNGTKLDILQSINSLAVFDEMWFLTAFPMVRIPMFFAEFPQ